MKRIEKKTPKDAVIWASWGHGHPLIYYGQRGTIADGIYHSAELQYVLDVPIIGSLFISLMALQG